MKRLPAFLAFFLPATIGFVLVGTPAQADSAKTPDTSLERSNYSVWAEAYDFHAAFSTGVWVPTGENAVLGAHPQFGAYLGTKRGNFEAGLAVLLRLANAPRTYRIEYEGNTYDTKRFLGLYVGVDVGYEILYWRKNGFLLLAGAGYDWFLSEYFEEDEQYKSVGSFLLNGGVGYRRYFAESSGGASYIEVHARYNLLEYKNEGGTDLSGDTVAVCLSFGRILY